MHRYKHTHTSCFLASCFLSVLLAWDHVVNFPFISCSLPTTFPCSFLALVYFWIALFFRGRKFQTLIFCRAPLILMLLIFLFSQIALLTTFLYIFLAALCYGLQITLSRPITPCVFSFMLLSLQLVLLPCIQNYRRLALMNSTLRIGNS